MVVLTGKLIQQQSYISHHVQQHKKMFSLLFQKWMRRLTDCRALFISPRISLWKTERGSVLNRQIYLECPCSICHLKLLPTFVLLPPQRKRSQPNCVYPTFMRPCFPIKMASLAPIKRLAELHLPRKRGMSQRIALFTEHYSRR